MGKRELLLIGAFVLLGSAAYWATAPAPPPGQTGFSLAALLTHVRREIQGHQATAELKTTTTVPSKPELTEVRFELGPTPISIVGETRDDIVCELSAWSNGYDEAEAKKYVAETKLRVSDLGPSIVIGIEYPQPATQRASLAIRMPNTLAVRIQPSRGKIDIANVASVDLAEARGEVSIRSVTGRLAIIHRGGALKVEDAGAVKLNTRGSVIELENIKGEAVLQMQSGELKSAGLVGPIDIDSNGARIYLNDLSKVRKPIRINAVGGEVSLGEVSSETRIEGRNTRITVAIAQPAAIAVYNEDDEPMRVTLPAGGGVQLDAVASWGALTLPSGMLEVKTEGNDQRASGAVNGGGPTLTLRSSHGPIDLSVQRKEKPGS